MKRPQQKRFAATQDEFTVDDAARRLTGQEHFDRATREQQDAMVGPEAAERIRKGEITLADLVRNTSPGDTPGFIVQKPLEDL